MDYFLRIAGALTSSLTLLGILWAFRDKIFKSGEKSKSITDRITVLERDDMAISAVINEIKKDLTNIKENHLSHLQEDITNIKSDISYIKGYLGKDRIL